MVCSEHYEASALTKSKVYLTPFLQVQKLPLNRVTVFHHHPPRGSFSRTHTSSRYMLTGAIKIGMLVPLRTLKDWSRHFRNHLFPPTESSINLWLITSQAPVNLFCSFQLTKPKSACFHVLSKKTNCAVSPILLFPKNDHWFLLTLL